MDHTHASEARDIVRAMAKYPRVREQHIAVFGEGGSGKTVLVSSFYGATQDGSYENELWDLVADDAGQHNRLYQNYLGMRDTSKTPMSTRFASTTYYFSLKLKNAHSDAAKKWPFDVLRLAWHDYPGEWFDQSPTTETEEQRRTDTFRSLLRSDVALVLFDAQKLLDYAGEEERYLKSLMANLRQGLLRLKDDILDDDERLIEFPRIWIFALSKADLVPEWTVDTFRDLVIRAATDDIERLRETIKEFVDTPDALSVGDDFIVLSSAEFELQPGSTPGEIDVSRRIGLNLLLPVASILPLERRVQWQKKMDIPWKVVASLADGAEVLAAGLVGAKFSKIEAAVSKMLKSSKAGDMAAKAALPLLIKAVGTTGAKLTDMHEQARSQHDSLRATLTLFKLELEQGVADKVIWTKK